jgi:hypothetical protein
MEILSICGYESVVGHWFLVVDRWGIGSDVVCMLFSSMFMNNPG